MAADLGRAWSLTGDDWGKNPEISTALALLAVKDPVAADEAQAALEWITGGEPGLALVTQRSVQNFCWYELPVKWMTGDGDPARVTAALADALDLQLPRYAAICNAYQASVETEMKAFRRAAAAWLRP